MIIIFSPDQKNCALISETFNCKEAANVGVLRQKGFFVSLHVLCLLSLIQFSHYIDIMIWSSVRNIVISSRIKMTKMYKHNKLLFDVANKNLQSPESKMR